MHHSRREVPLAELDMAVQDLPLLKTKHVIQQLRQRDGNWRFGFTIKAQRLACNMRDALQFLLCERSAMARLFVE